MITLKQSLLGSLALAALFIPTAFASAATAAIENLSPGATPMAKTSVTFKVAVTGFNTPYYQLTDSFAGSTINSTNINFGGNFQWVPIVSDIGTHLITIQVNDSGGNSATVTQSITVLPPPSISINSVVPGSVVMPGTTFSFSVSSPGFVNPTFIASDSFGGSSVNTVTIGSSGNFSWTPDATQNGEHAITVYANDSQGHSASATTVVRVGSGPTLAAPSNLNLNISPGQMLTFTLNPTGYQPTGFSVTDKFTGQSTLTNNNVNTSGLVTWIPTASDAGQHVATFKGQVGVYGQSATTTLTINVLGPNGVLLNPPVTTTAATTSGTTASTLAAQLAALQAQLAAGTTGGTAGTGYVFTSYLKQGSENDEVMELQKLLSKLGFLKVAPNGYFGPSTVAAVKKFQAAHGLDQLGAVGPGTRLELNTITAGTTSTTAAVTTTPSGTKYKFEHFMGVGSDDETDVLELQKLLVKLGFLTAEPTGYFGAGTEAAVKKFQTKHGLPVTGYVAKNTRAVLNSL